MWHSSSSSSSLAASVQQNMHCFIKPFGQVQTGHLIICLVLLLYAMLGVASDAFPAHSRAQEIFKQTRHQRRRYGFGLWQALDDAWDEANRMLLHREQPPIERESGPSESLCFLSGTCVCQLPGSEALHFHAQFIALMCKPHLLAPRQPQPRVQRQPQAAAAAAAAAGKKKPKPPKTRHRVLMEQGFFVVRLSTLIIPVQNKDCSWNRRFGRTSRLRAGGGLATVTLVPCELHEFQQLAFLLHPVAVHEGR